MCARGFPTAPGQTEITPQNAPNPLNVQRDFRFSARSRDHRDHGANHFGQLQRHSASRDHTGSRRDLRHPHTCFKGRA